jgi:hypothetical protein
MGLFALEHRRRAYYADSALYGSAVLALAAIALWNASAGTVLMQ